MSCQHRLSSWKQEVSTAFAQLSKAQVVGLVLWSAGIALVGSSGISQISASRGAGVGAARSKRVPTAA